MGFSQLEREGVCASLLVILNLKVTLFINSKISWKYLVQLWKYSHIGNLISMFFFFFCFVFFFFFAIVALCHSTLIATITNINSKFRRRAPYAT